MSFRKLLVLVHRWTGLTIGLFAVVLAVTGAGLALRPILDGLIYRDLLVPPASCRVPRSLDDQVAAARDAHPAGQILYTRVEAGASTMVRFVDNASIYVDPCTGSVLGEQGRWGGLFGRLEQLHRLAYWKNGPPNKLFKGTTALVLALASVVGGLYLWWPRRRGQWRRALTLDLKLRRRAFALNLHGVTGVYSSVVIFVVAATGVPIAFDWAKDGLYVLTDSRPTKAKFSSAVPDGQAGMIPLDMARRQLEQVMPGAEAAVFRYPRKPGEPVEIYAVGQDAPHGEARSYLYLDAVSGKEVGFQPYADLSRGRKLYYWMLAIHTGRAGGWFVDLLLAAGMLGVPVMAYTGIESYLRSRRRRAAGAAQAQKAAG